MIFRIYFLNDACVPVGHPVENLQGSFLPVACQGDGCAGNPESQCRCPGPETEPSGPHVVQEQLSCDKTAGDDPKQFIEFGFSFSGKQSAEQVTVVPQRRRVL